MSTPKQKSIKRYFDTLAPGYRKRFDHPFLKYFFQQRIDAALDALPAPPSSLLDIGAGTGSLYDAIQGRGWMTDYFGTDISAAMLSESPIPADRQFVGTLPGLALPRSSFSAIFLMGVSTYLSQKEMKEHLEWIHNSLETGGYCCITFTHRSSLDYRLRGFFRRVVPRRMLSEKVLGQSFSIQAYRPDEVALLSPKLTVFSTQWLNQTLPPFNRWFPRLTVWLAPHLQRSLPTAILPFFSSDFLMVFRKDH